MGGWVTPPGFFVALSSSSIERPFDERPFDERPFDCARNDRRPQRLCNATTRPERPAPENDRHNMTPGATPIGKRPGTTR